MVDKIQDLNLPTTVVTRLIKEALPDGINIGKEARSAIARAASIFIIYLTSSTQSAARKQKHKSLSSDNVFSALEEIEFENFIEPLRQSLEQFRSKANKDKKTNKQSNKVTNDDDGGDSNDQNTNSVVVEDLDDDEDDDVNESTAQEITDGTEIEE